MEAVHCPNYMHSLSVIPTNSKGIQGVAFGAWIWIYAGTVSEKEEQGIQISFVS